MATNKIAPLHLETERQPAMTVVHCTGQVDVESWTGLSTAVRALIPEGTPIRVDLAKVTRVDSTGIGALLGLWTAATRRKCDLKYVSPSKQVEDVIRLTSLLGMLEGQPAEEKRLRAALGS